MIDDPQLRFKDVRERAFFEQMMEWVKRGGIDKADGIDLPASSGASSGGLFDLMISLAYENSMAVAYKLLGYMSAPSGSVGTLYTVPASTSAIISGLTVYNFGENPTNFWVEITSGFGSSTASPHHIAYNEPIKPKERRVLLEGATLEAGMHILATVIGDATVGMHLFGAEVS